MRIFWFGMHKVLRQTELLQLRALGYEVFSPAYLSPIYDQSADRTIDYDQPTTLPKDVFDELLGYNFFYNTISPRIAEILNAYFQSAIVTISADWLNAFLAAYSGPVIYRVYGQHFALSNRIIEIGLWEKLVSRDDFSIVPFAAETLDREHQWFIDLCHEIVPYQIPDDVFAHSGIWQATVHRPVVTTHIPNIENAYYAEAYAAFRAQYRQRAFEITGPQRSHPSDSSIVGALPRQEFLQRLASSSGFLYNYRDEVCYLTPIEMMEIGGPVLYAPGSLLARFFAGPTPGLIPDPALAELQLAALMNGDKGLIGEIVAAQEPVRQRYDRALVQPAFDAAFRRLLGDPRRKAACSVRDRIFRGAQAARKGPDGAPTFVVFLHDDSLIARKGRFPVPSSSAGQAMLRCVAALAAAAQHPILVSCLERTRVLTLDLFADQVAAGRVELRVLPGTDTAGLPFADHLARLDFVAELNRRDDIAAILLPHPHCFPESLLFKGDLITYVQEYQPREERRYVFPNELAEDEEREETTVATLRASRLILASSAHTRHCLASSAAGRHISDRIAVFPPRHEIPKTAISSFRREAEFFAKTAGRRYLFYPAANLPNGDYAFLLKALAAARFRYRDLMLVVTDSLGRIPGVGEVADAHALKPHIVVLDSLEPADFDWLYAHAAALTYVSDFEGSLPEPIVEAVRHALPVIACRLPPIFEALGPAAQKLLLYRSTDAQAFQEALDLALGNRAGVVQGQSAILSQLDAPADDSSAIVALLSRSRAPE